MQTAKRPRELGLIVAFLVIVLFVTVYTFVLQLNYSNMAVDTAVAWDTRCADAIHRLVSNTFTRDDFENITTRSDMSTERYYELQSKLNELRSLNSTRYLYTAKRGADGRLIYLIDGLDLDADDFAYPGTHIEEEMVPYIDAALLGKTIYSQEIVDTTWGHIFTACYPVKDASGEIIGALCMEMDMEQTYTILADSNGRTHAMAITAVIVLLLLGIAAYCAMRKQKARDFEQQKALEKAAQAADAANRAKSTFLFNVSHDIRTPMNAILGFAELGQKNLGDAEKTGDCLRKIQISGSKMLAILDNVLELSRIESGKTVVEATAVEAGSVLDACLTMVQPELDKKHIELTVSREIEHPYVYLDTTLVTEIILNLISNSIKYTAEGGKIHCEMHQTEGTDGNITQVFTVRDDGIGMSEEFQKHIYESFARERSSTMSGVEGTGLGMGIVKKLIDRMNGRIELESHLGEGTTFTVYLPCLLATFEDTQPKKAGDSADVSILCGKRILLAEDNDLNAEIAIAMLSEVGLVIDRAENGVDCAEKLDKAPAGYYSLILMDIQMPVQDGYATTKMIRRFSDPKKANIPIIAMTANAFAEDREKALAVGMNDHVAKPMDMNKLIPLISRYV